MKICRVRDFLRNYGDLLTYDGLEVANFNVELAGKSDIANVNQTKKEMAKLLGVANQLYLKACRALKKQPDENCVSVTIKFESNTF